MVSRVLDLMNRVTDEGRNAVRGMRNSDPDDLEQALSRIPQEMVLEQTASFRLVVEGQAQPLHQLIRDDVYRLCREAIINAFRHSGAASIKVELGYSSRNLHVTVRDDGRGIEPQVLRSGREGHWGLSWMRARAATVGGRLDLQSSASGTAVDLSVPAHIAYELPPSRRRARWMARRTGRLETDVRERS